MKVKTKIELANKIMEMLDAEDLKDTERRRVCSYATKLYTAKIKGSSAEEVEEVKVDENEE